MKIVKPLGRQIVRPYTSLYSSVTGLAGTTSRGVREIRDVVGRIGKRDAPTDPDIIKASAITDGRARFEFLFERKRWTERELATRAKNLAQVQALFLLLTLAATGVMLWQASMLGEWGIFAAVGTATSWMGAALFGGYAGRYALMLAQLDERELFGWTRFAGRCDFWQRAAWPFPRALSRC